MTDLETTQSFEEALRALKVPVTEPRSYVYYDHATGLISCISNQEMSEFANKSLCMMPMSEVIRFLEGTDSTADYVVMQDVKDVTKHTLVKRQMELTPLRTVSKSLAEIEEGFKEAQICIERYVQGNKVRIYLVDKVRGELAKFNPLTVTIHGFKELSFYFTAKNDPTFLIAQITVAAKDLVTSKDVWIELDTDLDGTSLYTKKVFPEYEYKVLR